MAEDKKVKGFKVPISTHELVDKLIKDSGKDGVEWFEDVVNQIATNELVLEKGGIPANLRKHFKSDIASIKDAMELIETTFINQMNRVAVEKNNWTQFIEQMEKDFEEKENKLKGDIELLEQEILFKDQLIEVNENSILQMQTKIDGFDKLEEHLRKDIFRLEKEQERLNGELESAKANLESERHKYEEQLLELKEQHKTEKSSLNERIVELMDQIKSVEGIKEENRNLKDKEKSLQQTIEQQRTDYELQLTRLQEQADTEKEKALLAMERELRESFYVQSREDMKELYDKIEKLQIEKSQLEIENRQLKVERRN